MDRIGSSCWYREQKINNRGLIEFTKWTGGTLRHWGVDEHITVGIVEDEKTRLCKKISVENICFATSPGSNN
jgi:hypothetical protein